MFFKKYKQVIGMALASTLLLTGCSAATQEVASGETSTTGVAKEESNKDKAEPIVIRYGSHAASEEDPNYKDPVTGEYVMDEETRAEKLKVLEHIRETLNVDFQFVQFPGDTGEVLLQSVLAGDPICDVARIYTYGAGGILGQNILQPLDEWEELLKEEDPPKVFDKYYFLRLGGDHNITFLPLMYNIDYIEAVDALKVDGKTVYPTDLYLSGDWTWSTFKDYLEKIDRHYTNSQAPERPERRIEAFWSSHYDIVLQAVHAAGGSIYGRNGLEIESDATKEAVAFTQELIESGLVYVQNQAEGNQDIVDGRESIGRGETVFSLIEDWKTRSHSQKLAERGQSMGYVPFPRPDHMELDDPNYRDCRIPGESYAILKGTDEEKIPLAIQATYMYLNGETGEPKEEGEKSVFIGMDMFHPEIGQDMVDIYHKRSEETVVNELADVFSISGKFIGLVGDSIYGRNNTPKYSVAIEQQRGIFDDAIAIKEKALNSGKAQDNVVPKFEKLVTGTYHYPVGTDLSQIDFTKDFTATDNIDGNLDMATATVEIVDVDTTVAATYTSGIQVKIKDKNGNEAVSKNDVVIFDDKNTTPPTLAAKAEYRTIKLEEDANKINWANDFIENAVDKDGIVLNSRVEADLSELDTTTAGTYNVPLTVTDYANNKASITIEVEVVKGE
ncbi:MAG: hypothetical protein ACLSH8_05595 [Zhenhengia sp.]|uniref:hypothetical protein n=1 Tax=Zhenhengia sp. TaxID=2944208 RepID=UPI003995F57E